MGRGRRLAIDFDDEDIDPAPGAVPSIPAHVLRDRPWVRGAACNDLDPELFFPEGDGVPARRQTAMAKEVCAACPVRSACLDWALTVGESHGIWGGTTPEERRMLRRVPA